MPGTSAPTLTVRILLFASYADTLGSDSLEFDFEAPANVGDALIRLRSMPGGDQLPPRPMCALNLVHVTHDTVLSNGDELAVLPPLAGG